jgi:methylmalonyl-CoA carboxyltransferase large subunit
MQCRGAPCLPVVGLDNPASPFVEMSMAKSPRKKTSPAEPAPAPVIGEVPLRERVTEMLARKVHLREGGGAERIEKQHQVGKMTARERVALLTDPGTFHEMFLFAEHRATHFGMAGKEVPADGVVTGCAHIDHRPVHLASQDFTVIGGAAGQVHCEKIVEMMKLSVRCGTPFIFINDSGGARIQEGIDALSGYGSIFYHNVYLSGVVPQIAIIAGPCAGGAAYSPALTDFIIQTKQAQMFITGPQVIKQVTGEEVSAEELGGPQAQMRYSGVVHFVAENDTEALDICRRLLSFLPSNHVDPAPVGPEFDPIERNEAFYDLVPDDPRRGYDMHGVINLILDNRDFMEVQPEFAPNMIIGFGRVEGHTVGVVANQPRHLAGAIDFDASDKAAAFIRFLNAFNLPIITLVDVPGFLPGIQQEYGGIIRHGAKMLFAYSEATVPKVTVIIRKAYGGAYIAMNSKNLGADRVAAWPSAEIAVMGADGAAAIVFRKEIESAQDPAAKRDELIREYRERFSTPYFAASRRMVDNIIDPADTRLYIAHALEILHSKHESRPEKKIGLIPL